jgi:hypothetical protein
VYNRARERPGASGKDFSTMCRRCNSRRAPRFVFVIGLICIAFVPATPATAQEQPNPEELKKLYDEAISQLKAAQDRKNELAADNEKLQARIAELDKQLLDRDKTAAGWAERTWFYRSHYAAWERFLERYPRLREQWKQFLQMSELDPLSELPAWTEPSITKAE